MSKTDGAFVFIGTYPDEASAQADYDVVKGLHGLDAIGGFDAAVVTKDSDGKIHINKDETATRKGALGGVAVGAVVGILFPPAILGSAVVAGIAGAVGGHLWKGLSRKDVKELGEVIDEGEAALLVIGDVTVSKALEKAELRAVKEIKREVNVDLKELEKEIKAANK